MKHEYTEHIWQHNYNDKSLISSSTCERCGCTFFYDRMDRTRAPKVCTATPQWLRAQGKPKAPMGDSNGNAGFAANQAVIDQRERNS